MLGLVEQGVYWNGTLREESASIFCVVRGRKLDERGEISALHNEATVPSSQLKED